MSTAIDSTSSTSNVLESLGLTRSQANEAESTTHNELGQADFLALLTAQMQSQDPTNPMDNQEFVAQMAQFSTVQGIQELQTSFATLASALTSNQTLQAAQLVGRSVLVPGSIGELDAEAGMSGAVDLDQPVSDLAVQIYDSGGALVREISLGGQNAGMVDFKWDGLDKSGNAVSPGQYQFSASATVAEEAQSFDTYTLAGVTSVSMNGTDGSIKLNTDEFGEFSVDKVREIR